MNCPQLVRNVLLILIALLVITILMGAKGCTLFGPGYQEGYDSGYESGYAEGYDEGYNKGYQKGKEEKSIETYNQGYEKGHEKGYVESEKWWCDFYVYTIMNCMRRYQWFISYSLDFYYNQCLDGRVFYPSGSTFEKYLAK